MEIPVVHETTRRKPGATIGAPVVHSANNHIFHLAGNERVQRGFPEGEGSLDMHREEIIVTTTSYKPRTPAKPVLRRGGVEGEESFPSIQRSIHTRLPSADSGILADGGFDSLSRYRGKSFLSASTTCGDSAATDDDLNFTGIDSSRSGGGQSQQKLPKTASLPTKSFTFKASPAPSPRASEKKTPTPALRTSLPAARPTTSSQKATLNSSHNAPRSCDSKTDSTRNSLSFSDGLDASNSSSTSSSSSSLQSSSTTILNVSDGNVQSSATNQNLPSNKQSTNKRAEINVSTSNQNSDPSNHKKSSSDQSAVKILPSFKVMSSQPVKIAIGRNTVNIVQAKPPSLETNNHILGATSVSNQPTTFKFQVVNSARPNQPEANKARSKNSIALTRPLRLGAPPPPPTTKPVATETSNTNHQTTITTKLNQSVSQAPKTPQTVSTNSSVRVKPKIAPRPSVGTTKQCPQASPSRSSSIDSTIAPIVENGFFNNNEEIKKDVVVTEIPVTVRPSPPSFQSSRVEIPVKHFELNNTHSSVIHLSKPISVGASFSRFTPERQLHQRQSIYERLSQEKQLSKHPIYENVFNIKDGFSFDDPNTRMRQAELILKQSDELINDALKMLGSSPYPLLSTKPAKRNGFSMDVEDFPEGERIVEGSDDCSSALPSEKEHRVPIFDVQSGKFFGGSRTSHPDGIGATSASLDSKVKDVAWNERKSRIDSALLYLKTELASLREMDNTLISHFRKCQETIDALKNQRDVWEGLSEEGEEGDYWDDYEITEFNKKYLDSPVGSESSNLSPVSHDPSHHDAQSIAYPVPQLPQRGHVSTSANRRGSVTQDVEATL